MQPAEKIRVLIVDDHEVVRLGLTALFNQASDIQVVGQAADVEPAIEAAAKLKPNVVVMDVRLPGGSGVDACRAIRAQDPAIQVIMLTSYSDDEALFSAVMAGAAGYVMKQIGSHDLVNAIRTVAKGGSLLDPQVTGKVLERVRRQAQARDKGAELTDQERRILALIAEGKTNKEIAAEVYLSEKTVRNYVSHLLAKLEVGNRAEAAALAVRENWIDLSQKRDGR